MIRRSNLSTWRAAPLLLAVVLACAPVMADEAPVAKTEPAKTSELSAAEIAGLIKQLDAADFDTREQATKRLATGGKTVIAPVLKAADTDNLEVATRCLTVLKELYGSPDTAVKQAAGAAVKELRQSKLRSIARRAAEILEPPAAQPNQAGVARININGARVIQLGGPAALARAVRMSVRNENGRTTIDVQEGEKKVSISHSEGKDITIRSMEPAAEKGKDPVTKEYKAKDLAELKEKHPEGLKLYEQYAKSRAAALGNIQIQAGGIQIAPAQIQIEAVAEAAEVVNGEQVKKAGKELEATRQELAKLTERLKELSGKAEIKGEELRKLVDDLQAASKRLAEAQKALPK